MKSLPYLVCLAPAALAAVVRYNVDLTWEQGAPNGQSRQMVYMNGQFPGPTIRAQQYDQIEFTIQNHLPYNATVHFHGIEMSGTPWSDGVPGLTQRPVQPGQSFTYRWTATQYGTYWYHAHARGLMADGLYGPIWIERYRAMRNAERDPHLILISDWTKFTSEEYQSAMEVSGVNVFCSDSILINGRGSLYCPGLDAINAYLTPELRKAIDNRTFTDKGCYPNFYNTQGNFTYDESKLPDGLNSGCYASAGSREVIEVDPSRQWASMKFIGGTAMKSVIASIDEHPMWIYEVDGNYVEPQLVHTVTIFNGQRYSAMIKLDKPAKDYTITIPDTSQDQIIAGYATMRYTGGSDGDNSGADSVPYLNYGGLNTTADVITLNDSTLVPYPIIPIPRAADQLVNLTMGRLGAAYRWTLEGYALYDIMANYDSPILLDLNAQHNLADKVVVQFRNGTWVDIVFQIGHLPNNTPISAAHIIHKHSNKFFVLGQGTGIFSWQSVAEAATEQPHLFELEKPLYRDSIVVLNLSGPNWAVIRYQVVNPGPFLIHCHIESHLFNGMAVALLDGVDQWPEVPPEYRR
ncbi:hypothetical protein ARAM_000845 [Aspergillus rambellii]|uniref:Conidial pigment biosynthesis oxidase Arb2/brown2 n=1 Tax=Aspergillus rambellii TaxID=308745 RepID=A0A0F8W762_9EURO|nr:hypothetical protein ARAM_000845 [Aspergillus rambellii]